MSSITITITINTARNYSNPTPQKKKRYTMFSKTHTSQPRGDAIDF